MKLPHYIKVTDKVTFADSKLFRIRVNPQYKDNKGLLSHEYQHIKQLYYFLIPLLSLAAFTWFNYRQDVGLVIALVALFAKDLIYTFVPKARFIFEAQAYAAQLKNIDKEDRESSLVIFSEVLANNYELDVTIEEARKAIEERI